MLSQLGLSSMAFINLFLIPIIGLRIYCKRNNIIFDFSKKTLYYYIIITVLNVVLTHLLLLAAEAIISDTIYLESSKYTILALVSCVLLPLIIEILRTFFKAEVFVSLRKKEGTKNDEE